MKRYQKILAAAASVLALTGCTSINTSDGASGIPQPQVKAGDYQAVYKVQDARVKGSGEVKVLFGLFSWGAEGYADNCGLSGISFLPSPSNFAKSAAVYNTCKANKADVLMATRYTVTTKDYFVYKVVECEVVGNPAVITGVKKVEPYLLKNGEQIQFLADAPQK